MSWWYLYYWVPAGCWSDQELSLTKWPLCCIPRLFIVNMNRFLFVTTANLSWLLHLLITMYNTVALIPQQLTLYSCLHSSSIVILFWVLLPCHHGDRSVYLTDAVLHGAACIEKNTTHVNTEGSDHQTTVAITLGMACHHWKIINLCITPTKQNTTISCKLFQTYFSDHTHIAKITNHVLYRLQK